MQMLGNGCAPTRMKLSGAINTKHLVVPVGGGGAYYVRFLRKVSVRELACDYNWKKSFAYIHSKFSWFVLTVLKFAKQKVVQLVLHTLKVFLALCLQHSSFLTL